MSCDILLNVKNLYWTCTTAAFRRKRMPLARSARAEQGHANESAAHGGWPSGLLSQAAPGERGAMGQCEAGGRPSARFEAAMRLQSGSSLYCAALG